MSKNQWDGFTAREQQVATCLLKGKSNKEIAQDLGIKERTVEVHLQNIFRKVGLNSRVKLLIWLENKSRREITETT